MQQRNISMDNILNTIHSIHTTYAKHSVHILTIESKPKSIENNATLRIIVAKRVCLLNCVCAKIRCISLAGASPAMEGEASSTI